ncbi:hypothetical protein C723_2471 [Christiangramia flava JLT2011]|uniref:Uncharacterized protein n=1 Tax=Christiangramia flava JLT2011 TaxID=1229726 RepID=A0A1L7I0G8_9FLAO|nr:hypothetical protein GRFL_0356 [Christiangramia flava JLT2011]OSS38753.1 hypothetical protein C723_2471 [Christiangramia flava JLT2011]
MGFFRIVGEFLKILSIYPENYRSNILHLNKKAFYRHHSLSKRKIKLSCSLYEIFGE